MNPTDPQFQPILPDAPEPQQPVQPIQPTPQSMDVVAPPPAVPVPAEQPIQMPPYAPAQPPVQAEDHVPDIVTPVMPAPTNQPSAPHKKDTLGIISIVCGVTGLFPVGFILGLVGASRAKKAKRSVVLSRIGWILNCVNLLLATAIIGVVFLAQPALQRNSRDLERENDMGSINASLDEFFSKNFGYPNSLDKLNIKDDQALISPNGKTVKINNVVSDEAEAKASADPTGDVQYTYTPYGKPACLTTCDGYVLKSLIENPTASVPNPLVGLGANNL